MARFYIKDALRTLLGIGRPAEFSYTTLPFKVRQIPPGMRDQNSILKLSSDLRRAKLGIKKCDRLLRNRDVRKDASRYNRVLGARAHFRQLEEHVEPILAAEESLRG